MLRTYLLAAAATAALAAVPTKANDFSFTGSLPTPGTVQSFDFNVGAPSVVTLRTYSYAGGTNAHGMVIARGGFDPILALFSLPGGALINQNDDGGCGLVAADAVSGRCWDTYLSSSLAAGNYRVSIQVYPNFANGPNFSDGFRGASTFTDVSGVPNNPRDSHWAFDILNVNEAVQNTVPEPASWALMIAGFGLVGTALRRRTVTVAA